MGFPEFSEHKEAAADYLRLLAVWLLETPSATVQIDAKVFDAIGKASVTLSFFADRSDLTIAGEGEK